MKRRKRLRKKIEKRARELINSFLSRGVSCKAIRRGLMGPVIRIQSWPVAGQ